MRKLSSIRQVSGIEPIEGADRIEKAFFGGWTTIVPKGVLSPGDLAVYFEIDSLLPVADPAFSHLTKNLVKVTRKKESCSLAMGCEMVGVCYALSQGCPRECGGEEEVVYSRLRTMKMRGVTSQGLALPLRAFPGRLAQLEAGILRRLQQAPVQEVLDDLNEKMPLDEMLGVLKYEKPEEVEAGNSNVSRVSTFPSYIPKTDQERVQNIPLEKVIADGPYQVTIKMDGSSCTVWVNEEGVGMASRNQTLVEPTWTNFPSFEDCNHFGQAVLDQDIPRKLAEFYELSKQPFAIQGEVCGPAIQGNKEKLEKPTFFLFSVFNIKEGAYESPEYCRMLAETLDIQHVPVLSTRHVFEDVTYADILAMAEGKSYNPATNREGLVFTAVDKNRYGHYPHFKAISQSWLAKHE
ncbi:RNA ligase [Pseudomonas phage vB_PaeM_G1]|uniref:RNA ligase n=1 Tax=Pseudomonas phage vB_PaeM_G1 TaxID=1983539 RepID=A0A218L3Z6_9CAUD|nr:RNA ligase [Pseudomonas phage vB_PaeM_G1]ARW57362.1 RNA ligase [Pseudomonas phage vB_PaeM_G1]